MRKYLTGPRLIGAIIVAVVLIALFFAMRSPPVPVETAIVARGPMTVTVDDEGETRVTDMYVVAAPISGELQRVPLKPGDPVVAGSTLLARIQPAEPDPLSARAHAEARATVRSLEARLAASQARVGDARAQFDLTARELARTEELARRGFVAQAALDRARAAHDRADSTLAEARQAVEATRHDLDATRAALIVPGSAAVGRGSVAVTSPISGAVLRVPQESARVVSAGTPLVEVGDPQRIEIVVDLLSADAVRIREGAPVSIERWGGDRSLRGRVRRIEPFGFRKISALGVEEQRVNVIIDFQEPLEALARIGHGYRAIVRIVAWSGRDIVQVPISALFRSGNRWMVYAVDARGRARLIPVQVGRMNDETAQVLECLAPEDRVILHPGDRVAEGVRVEERERR